MAHVYISIGIRLALENGVKCIEHTNYIDEPTLNLAIEKGAWLCVQTLVFVNTPAGMDAGQIARFQEALQGLDKMFTFLKLQGDRTSGDRGCQRRFRHHRIPERQAGRSSRPSVPNHDQ